MSLLTIPSGLIKGSPFTVTLDKSALFSLSAVVSNAHFSDQSKVATCLVKYQGNVAGALFGHARLMRFDLSQPIPSHALNVSSAAADLFSISQILLVDHEGAVFSVPASQIPALDLNFSGSGGGGGGGGGYATSIQVMSNSYDSSTNMFSIMWNYDYPSAEFVGIEELQNGTWQSVLTTGIPVSYGVFAGDIGFNPFTNGASGSYRLAVYSDPMGLSPTGVVSAFSLNVAGGSGTGGTGGAGVTLNPIANGDTLITISYSGLVDNYRAWIRDASTGSALDTLHPHVWVTGSGTATLALDFPAVSGQTIEVLIADTSSGHLVTYLTSNAVVVSGSGTGGSGGGGGEPSSPFSIQILGANTPMSVVAGETYVNVVISSSDPVTPVPSGTLTLADSNFTILDTGVSFGGLQETVIMNVTGRTFVVGETITVYWSGSDGTNLNTFVVVQPN